MKKKVLIGTVCLAVIVVAIGVAVISRPSKPETTTPGNVPPPAENPPSQGEDKIIRVTPKEFAERYDELCYLCFAYLEGKHQLEITGLVIEQVKEYFDAYVVPINGVRIIINFAQPYLFEGCENEMVVQTEDDGKFTIRAGTVLPRIRAYVGDHHEGERVKVYAGPGCDKCVWLTQALLYTKP